MVLLLCLSDPGTLPSAPCVYGRSGSDGGTCFTCHLGILSMCKSSGHPTSRLTWFPTHPIGMDFQAGWERRRQHIVDTCLVSRIPPCPGHPRKLNKQPFSSDNARGPSFLEVKSPKNTTQGRGCSLFGWLCFFAASSCLVSSSAQHSGSRLCIFCALGFSGTHAQVSKLPKVKYYQQGTEQDFNP